MYSLKSDVCTLVNNQPLFECVRSSVEFSVLQIKYGVCMFDKRKAAIAAAENDRILMDFPGMCTENGLRSMNCDLCAAFGNS